MDDRAPQAATFNRNPGSLPPPRVTADMVDDHISWSAERPSATVPDRSAKIHQPIRQFPCREYGLIGCQRN